jgi:hypothetical protein
MKRLLCFDHFPVRRGQRGEHRHDWRQKRRHDEKEMGEFRREAVRQGRFQNGPGIVGRVAGGQCTPQKVYALKTQG